MRDGRGGKVKKVDDRNVFMKEDTRWEDFGPSMAFTGCQDFEETSFIRKFLIIRSPVFTERSQSFGMIGRGDGPRGESGREALKDRNFEGVVVVVKFTERGWLDVDQVISLVKFIDPKVLEHGAGLATDGSK